jgi:hypothetical protein
MASDDTFKKAQKAGADWLESARARAEEFLRELSRAADTTPVRAQGTIDEVIEGSKKGTEQLVNSIRSEIAAQLGLLGLATKTDLADLERRLSGRAAGAKKAASSKKAAPAKKATPAGQAARSAGTKKAAPAKKAAAKKAAN